MLSKGPIIIAGVPRSGTSWFGEIINSSEEVCYRIQPYFSYAFKNFIDHTSDKTKYESFFDLVQQSADSFIMQKERRESNLYPNFIKNTEPSILVIKETRYHYLFSKIFPMFTSFKMVCIIRNPCAVINSWVQSPREFPPGASVDKEWRLGLCKNEGKEENFYGFYKWREATNLFLDLKEKYPDRVYIIPYEKLVNDTYAESEKILRFLEIEFTRQTKEFIEISNSQHNEERTAVFKNKSVKDSWRKELPKPIIDEIYSELSGTRLEQYLI